MLRTTSWLSLACRSRLFLESRTIGNSDHAKLRQPRGFIFRFDAARKNECAYARCRVYDACDNLRRSHLHGHRVRADANQKSLAHFSGATAHRSKTGLKLSSISRCVHRRDRFIVAVSWAGRETEPDGLLSFDELDTRRTLLCKAQCGQSVNH
ncbi:MAG: hypothetical protein J0H42_09700 [Rhizobiales bacterium]|nr:hypothetical protein [Hyphomicrobiales bacterium]